MDMPSEEFFSDLSPDEQRAFLVELSSSEKGTRRFTITMLPLIPLVLSGLVGALAGLDFGHSGLESFLFFLLLLSCVLTLVSFGVEAILRRQRAVFAQYLTEWLANPTELVKELRKVLDSQSEATKARQALEALEKIAKTIRIKKETSERKEP